MNIAPYIKAWIAGLGTSLMSLIVIVDKVSEAAADDVITFDEIGVLVPIVAAQIATIIGVFGARNKPVTDA